jgi:flagella basal body P-ring formation protein FlgA
VGRRLLRNVGTHRALDLKDLDKPFLLRKGDPVTIVFDQPGIIVTARGQVTADGGLGDTVPVVNVSSKKTVYCRVVDTQTVRAAQ